MNAYIDSTESAAPQSVRDDTVSRTNLAGLILGTGQAEAENLDFCFLPGTGDLRQETDVAHRPPRNQSRVDKVLLERALTMALELDADDSDDALLAKEALLVACSDLWEGVALDSRQRQNVLAMVEGSLLQLEPKTPGLSNAVVEAFSDLGAPMVIDAQVDVLRRRFIALGYDPLAFLGDAADE
jgi:hypothetical protein